MKQEPLKHWPETDAEVDALPIDVLAAPVSGGLITRRQSYFSDRTGHRGYENEKPGPEAAPIKYRPPPEPLTPEKRAKILKIRFEDGLSLEKVATACGCSHRTVSRVIREAGLSKPRRRAS
jgi:DNA invertase Pin-like site-specific DNA recombinase